MKKPGHISNKGYRAQDLEAQRKARERLKGKTMRKPTPEEIKRHNLSNEVVKRTWFYN